MAIGSSTSGLTIRSNQPTQTPEGRAQEGFDKSLEEWGHGVKQPNLFWKEYYGAGDPQSGLGAQRWVRDAEEWRKEFAPDMEWDNFSDDSSVYTLAPMIEAGLDPNSPLAAGFGEIRYEAGLGGDRPFYVEDFERDNISQTVSGPGFGYSYDAQGNALLEYDQAVEIECC